MVSFACAGTGFPIPWPTRSAARFFSRTTSPSIRASYARIPTIISRGSRFPRDAVPKVDAWRAPGKESCDPWASMSSPEHSHDHVRPKAKRCVRAAARSYGSVLKGTRSLVRVPQNEVHF
jgi:hypothetical protein